MTWGHVIAQAVCETLFWFGLDGSLTKAMPRPQETGVDASRSLAVPKSMTLSVVLRSASSSEGRWTPARRGPTTRRPFVAVQLQSII